MNLFDCSNENFRKCGEITTALKVGQKVYALNCGFCSKVFNKLHAFMLHIGENHERELFRCYGDESCVELSVEVLTEAEDERDTVTVEVQFAEITKEDEEIATDFQDPLEQPSLNGISGDSPNNSEVNEEVETMVHEDFYDDDYEDEDVVNINEVEDKLDSSDTASSCESDDEQTHETQANYKELTLAIIESYRNHSILWNANDSSSKSRKQRMEAYTSIANSINKQMNISLKWTYIRDRIKELSHKFYSEFQNKKHAKSKDEDCTPIWYYEKLLFLDTSMKYKQQSRKSGKVLESELFKLTDAQNLELIDVYKSFPCLWDVQHTEFRFINRRKEAMNEMIQNINTKINLNLTQNELQKLIDNIHDACKLEKLNKLRCERFKKTFTPTCKFYEQISFLNDNVSPFKCDFCEETFKGSNTYLIHKSKHNNSKPFTCSLCDRGFTVARNLTVHLRRHTRDYPFECKVCKKRFPTTFDENIHMRCHTGEKPYFCEICGRSYRTWTLFDNHTRRHQKRPSHICTICSKGFYEKPRLTEHMNVHLNIRDKVCNFCGKSFTSSRYLRQHKQIHAEKKKFVCRICKKDFAQAAGLNGHMKSHGTTIGGT